MSDKQAKIFALSIFCWGEVYIKEHPAEFEAWKKEQEVRA